MTTSSTAQLPFTYSNYEDGTYFNVVLPKAFQKAKNLPNFEYDLTVSDRGTLLFVYEGTEYCITPSLSICKDGKLVVQWTIM